MSQMRLLLLLVLLMVLLKLSIIRNMQAESESVSSWNVEQIDRVESKLLLKRAFGIAVSRSFSGSHLQEILKLSE